MTARPLLLRIPVASDARLPVGECVCTWLAASAAAWLLIWGLWEMIG